MYVCTVQNNGMICYGTVLFVTHAHTRPRQSTLTVFNHFGPQIRFDINQTLMHNGAKAKVQRTHGQVVDTNFKFVGFITVLSVNFYWFSAFGG
jgi:hypothetical protein